MTQGLDLPSQLIEQLPSETRRYDDTNAGPYVPITIPIGPLGADIHAGWKHHFNPTEGRSYFWNSELHVLTSSDILDPSILQQVAHWAQVIRPYVLRKFVEAGANYDIVLDVFDGEGNMSSCGYYLVDYTSLRVLWLQDVSTASLGLPFVHSRTHLKDLLLEQFWLHCKNMPVPHQDFASESKRLLATLAASIIDSTTPAYSHLQFPLVGGEAYLKGFSRVLEAGSQIHINWSLAHIMDLLTRNRIAYLYGERSNSGDGGRFTSSRYPPSTLKATLVKAAISALVAYLSSFTGAPYLSSLIRSRDTENATYYDPHAEVRHPLGFFKIASGSKLELK